FPIPENQYEPFPYKEYDSNLYNLHDLIWELRSLKNYILSPQEALIKDLNPVIRGWSYYYKASDIGTVGELWRQDNLTYLKLCRWAKRRTLNVKTAHRLYWRPIGDRNWVFATKGDDPKKLILHTEFATDSNNLL
ncbi:group II intron maturase-specific domain-containing protein, partial [Nodularia sphaerocarpa]